MKKYFVKNKRVLALLLFLVMTITAVLPAVGTYAADTSQFSVKVTMGYDGKQEVDIHVPVIIEVTNNGADFNGTIQFTVPSRTGNVMYEQELNLAKGATKKVEMAPMFYANDNYVYVAIVDRKGKVLFSDVKNTNVTTSRDYVRVGVLSDDSAVARILDRKFFTNSYYANFVMYTVDLTIDNIYENCEAMESLDVIIISNFSTDTLSEKQISAIMGWVEKGGLLLFGTGDTAQKTLAGFKNVLEYQDKGLVNVTTDYGSFNKNPILSEGQTYEGIVKNILALDPAYLDKLITLIEESQWTDIFNSIRSEADSAVKFNYRVNFSDYNDDLWMAVSKDENIKDLLNEIYYTVVDNLQGMPSSPFEFSTYATFNAMIIRDLQNRGYSDEDIFYSIVIPEGTAIEASEEIKYNPVEATLWDFVFGKNTVAAGDPNTGKDHAVFKYEDYGKGSIVMAAMDLSKKPFVSYEYNAAVLVAIIEGLIGNAVEERYKEYDASFWSYGGSDYSDTLLNNLSSNSPVPAMVYAILFIAYIVFCFMLFSVLKKKKKSLLLWPIIAASALICSLLVFFISFATKSVKPVANIVRVVYASDNGPQSVENYCTVTLPKNKTYELSFSNDITVNYRDRGNYTYTTTDIDKHSVTISEKDGKQIISFKNSTIMSTKSLTFTEKNYEHGTISLEGLFNYGVLTGSVTNNYGYDLTDCSILINGCVAPIGDLKNGQTIDLSTLKLVGTVDGYAYRNTPEAIRNEAILGKWSDAPTILLGMGGKNVIRRNAKINALNYIISYNEILNLSDYWNIHNVSLDSNNLPIIYTDKLTFVGFNSRAESIVGGSVTEIMTEIVVKGADK